ncbi:glucose-1-phosphate adenylyltransferase [Ruminococcus sp. OM06-36AC]|nr:glucose-1-phosphate adenylyltransferase [Ruminococcus sp. OM06-36AC]HCD40219.1 glucose-1-phosphate adenylyltransferase [Ruminococcus sp.]HCY34722.1 glucose-1-phosphate adenylyltransferase [Ruminococcus sp.]
MMKIKKKCVAMLLAGGQGSRLYALTQKVAKPAIPYGGKNRFIDFPLSNCINSGIDTVGVLTQYQPMVLNEYIGNGQPWDLDKMHGGVHVLPPYQTAAGASWYEGTANAIYQNMAFIERYDPEYVIVLGGDHIYKMDYSKMLDYHIANNADSTIAVIDVPRSEASRFGIMTCDEEGRIVDFTEKPKEPKSTLASMGIYVFSWEKLRKYLIENENANTGSKDFGKDIIPAMLANDERLFAYEFEGYWKDVGTLDSLWEANMDLLSPSVPLNLYDPNWKVYSRHNNMPPQYIGKNAHVENSMITEGSVVDGTVDFSIISSGVTIEEGASVKYSIVMPGTTIKKNAVVEYAIIGENCVVESDAMIGMNPESVPNRDDWGIAVLGHNITISSGKRVLPKEIISENL